MGIDIGPIVFGWFWALVWGWLVCNVMSKKIIGVRSVYGYLATALFSVPFGSFLSLHVEPPMSHIYNPQTMFFLKAYYFLGMFGLLPEGRESSAVYHALNFYVMFLLGFAGFYLTARLFRPAKR